MLSWELAEERCQENRRSHITSIHNFAENAAVQSLVIQHEEPAWIGFIDLNVRKFKHNCAKLILNNHYNIKYKRWPVSLKKVFFIILFREMGNTYGQMMDMFPILIGPLDCHPAIDYVYTFRRMEHGWLQNVLSICMQFANWISVSYNWSTSVIYDICKHELYIKYYKWITIY